MAGCSRASILALLCLALACSQAPREGRSPAQSTDPGWFVDATESVGLDFVHDSGVDGSFFFPQILGSGGALFDHDGDGDLDLYLVDSAGPNRLYAGDAGGRFADRTAQSGLGDSGYGMGAAIGDYDNDGDIDLYTANFGEDRLYRNRGDGTFDDVTSVAGIGGDAWSTSAGFCDFDADGFLDLFVVTYVEHDPSRRCTDAGGRPEYCAPAEFRGRSDVLYHNRGDGTFEDVSVSSGIAAAASRGLGLACADLDADGRLDFFVANDAERNELWSNRGDGTFEDRAVVMGAAVNLFGKPEGSMGVALGDVSGDGKLDLFVTHLGRETNTLYTTLDGAAFQDTTATADLGPSSLPYTGFGTVFLDADHDGDLDLAAVNGRVARGDGPTALERTASGWRLTPEGFRSDYGEPNLFYENRGDGRFRDACGDASDFCAPRNVGRGLLVGDIDHDGDLDLIVTNSNGPARFLRNDAPKRGHWLVVRAMEPAPRRDAIGATVFVEAAGRTQLRPVTHTYSYLVAGDAAQHFGLGEAERVDALGVVWPDGVVERFDGVAVDRTVELVRRTGRADPS